MGKNEWVEITGTPIARFEKEGDAVEGKLDSIKDGQFGGKQFLIETEEGIVALPELATLQTKFANISVGSKVKVEFVGLRQSKKNPAYSYKEFKVFSR